MEKLRINRLNGVFRRQKQQVLTCLLLLLIFITVLLCGCTHSRKDADENKGAGKSTAESASENNASDSSGGKRDKLKVVATIFPQYDFVRQIAGDKADLKLLLKPGEESHSYEPTPKDIIAIQNCDLFIYVGGENDEWIEDILGSLDTGRMRTLRLVDCVETVSEEHVEGMKEERSSEEGAFDEHVWTTPQNVIKIVDNITDILCGADKKNEKSYIQAAEKYVKKLKALDEDFREVVKDSPKHVLLFGDRFPFRYFAEEYNLEYYAAFPGCASDTEPSAATMAYLINKVKDDKIRIVLKMELSNDNIANAIAEATGTKVKVFYSCHNITADQFAAGETYLSMMEKNVETLREALLDGVD